MSGTRATTSSNGGTGTQYIDVNGDILEQTGWTDCPGCGRPICDAVYHTAKCVADHREFGVAAIVTDEAAQDELEAIEDEVNGFGTHHNVFSEAGYDELVENHRSTCRETRTEIASARRAIRSSTNPAPKTFASTRVGTINGGGTGKTVDSGYVADSDEYLNDVAYGYASTGFAIRDERPARPIITGHKGTTWMHASTIAAS